jgi:hypothetical protein
MNRKERSIAEVGRTDAQLERMRWIASLWTVCMLLCASVSLWDHLTVTTPVEAQTVQVLSAVDSL